MWCNVCQCDVVTELTADHSRAVCSTCGQVLSTVAAEQPAEAAQPDDENPRAQARELLDRWASSHLFDPYGPPKQGTAAPPEAVPQPQVQSQPPSVIAAQPQTIPAASQIPPGSPPITTAPMPGHAAGVAQPQPAVVTPTSIPQPQTIPQPHISPISPGPAATTPAAPAPVVPVTGQPSPHAPVFQEVVPQPPPPVPAKPDPAVAVAQLPAQQPPQPAAPDMQTSAEELDRLTNEILSRVSQIGEDRKRRIELAAADLATAESRETRPRDVEAQDARDDEVFAGIDLTRRVDTAHSEHRPHGESTSGQLDAPKSNVTDESDRDDESDHNVTTLHSTLPPANTSHAETADAEESGGLPGLGQLLAYLGILGLTAGTSLVIVGYFGGPATYAPTGWLVSTIGQMLLFLGIVTLVSNGMEETSNELQKTVNTRLDDLTSRMEKMGDRLIRIESAETEIPRRPKMLDRSESRRSEETTSLRD